MMRYYNNTWHWPDWHFHHPPLQPSQHPLHQEESWQSSKKQYLLAITHSTSLETVLIIERVGSACWSSSKPSACTRSLRNNIEWIQFWTGCPICLVHKGWLLNLSRSSLLLEGSLCLWMTSWGSSQSLVSIGLTSELNWLFVFTGCWDQVCISWLHIGLVCILGTLPSFTFVAWQVLDSRVFNRAIWEHICRRDERDCPVQKSVQYTNTGTIDNPWDKRNRGGPNLLLATIKQKYQNINPKPLFPTPQINKRQIL